MFKIIFVALFAAVSAGVIHDHFGPAGLVLGPVPAAPVHAAPIVHAGPIVHAAPVAIKAHAATSFANSNLVALHPQAVAVAPAHPVVHAAPVAPVLLGHGFGHGFYGHH